jgi:hypothetical protein
MKVYSTNTTLQHVNLQLTFSILTVDALKQDTTLLQITNFNLLLHSVASAASFSDFTDTFSWAASNASLNFCAPMTKQNHNLCDKGPGPNLPQQ